MPQVGVMEYDADPWQAIENGSRAGRRGEKGPELNHVQIAVGQYPPRHVTIILSTLTT